MSAAVEVTGLVKEYPAVTAVGGIDLTITAGEVFALLGPNGAGKSTTVEILEGHRTPTSGSVSVLGMDPETGGRAFRERIGIVLQDQAIEKELTVRESLSIYGSMFPRRRHPDELIEIVGLREKADIRIKTLSGGQRRRLELALGLVGDPDLIFLDEPTTGFDPSARRQAWTIIENLRSLGKTILLTTHYMEEAQHLADRVAVISKGQIVAEGTPDTLGGRQTAITRISFSVRSGPVVLPDTLETAPGEDGTIEMESTDPTRDLHTLTSWAIERNVVLEGLSVAQPNLEDVYLDLVGRDV